MANAKSDAPQALDPAFLNRPIAHRAYHDRARGAPENSRAAIQRAVDAGYGIEIDLQLSKDGQAMVFHDYDLARLTADSGPVRQRSAAELQAIPLADAAPPPDAKSPDATSPIRPDGIPTLSDVLSLVAGKVPLLIELKDQDGAMGPNIGPLERATAAALKAYAGPVALMSFNPHSVEALQHLCPDIPRGLTTCAYGPDDFPTLAATTRNDLARIEAAGRLELAFLSHHHRDLANPRVRDLKNSGLAILCWTIRTPAQEAKAREIAANITFEEYAA